MRVCVLSADTDVVILMDLVANNLLGATTKLNFSNVIERVKVLGSEKSRALIGFHSFTGADWGGVFVVITEERRMRSLQR